MIFEVKDASFGYKKGREILRNISFSLGGGEVMSVLGCNGVGKTTLLKCMLGFLPWKSGCTEVDGKNWNDWKRGELWKHIGYVPQAKRSAFSFTTEEMVLLGRNAHIGMISQPGAEDRKIAERCMEMVHMEHLKGRLCGEISGGELQMILIARALAADPDLLILDEPESNLDFKNQLVILNTIRELCDREHISAIFNTHYPEHALAISDKALILYKDGVSRFGTAAQVITEENLSEAFDVDIRIRTFCVEGKDFPCVMPVALERG